MAGSEGAFTRDHFFGGDLTIWQNRFGYRFSIDAVLLAGHIQLKPKDRVVDMGTGCGVIPLLLGRAFPEAVLWGVEIQGELAALARRNVSFNNMEGRITVLQSDLRHLSVDRFPSPVDVVVANPPYRRIGTGRVNPHAQKALARHEIKTTLADVVAAAAGILKAHGRLAVIYPAGRTADLLLTMRQGGVEPKWMRSVHSLPGDPAKMILVKGVKGGGPEMEVAPPLHIYDKRGNYTPEVQRMFGPDNENG